MILKQSQHLFPKDFTELTTQPVTLKWLNFPVNTHTHTLTIRVPIIFLPDAWISIPSIDVLNLPCTEDLLKHVPQVWNYPRTDS